MFKMIAYYFDMVIPWTKGNRDSGYRLRDLFAINVGNLGFRILFAKYPPGACQRPHVDKLNGYHLIRLLFVLKPAQRGGKLNFTRTYFNLFDRVILFNPKYQHEVEPVLEGMRYSMLFTFYFPKSVLGQDLDILSDEIAVLRKSVLEHAAAVELLEAQHANRFYEEEELVLEAANN